MFTTDFIQGLWKCRHKYPDTRETLRWLIRYERQRRSRNS